jgi:lipopolysaccharide transport system ATP-binding protein
MSRNVIEVEGVSKSYTVQERPRQGSLRDAMGETVRAIARWRGGRRASEEAKEQRTFWALKDVSFSIKAGERVAIVGRNGAGKSTLLKLLSRITSPTRGRITIRGRVSSLLEVGTGFHPDLTGRENIYMNGAILGMTRSEIRRKFDDIVAFAEIERFLDTPVKRYSSGMAVRLAFAVAAHLDPEILIVDEVLSVGDAEFQRKCIGKMQEVSTGAGGGGRTVLFVSHSMAAVQALCTSGILMQRGQVAFVGPVNDVVERYIAGIKTARLEEGAVEGPDFELVSAAATDGDNGPLQTFRPAQIEIAFRPKHRVIDAAVHILIEDPVGSPILGLDSTDFVARRVAQGGELLTCTFNIESLPLTPGPVRMRIWLKSWAEEIAWEVPKIFELTVEGGAIYGARSIDRQWHGHTSVVATASI